MNRALWSKSVRDAWLLMLCCAAVLMLLHLLFVWLVSRMNLAVFETFLKFGFKGMNLPNLLPLPLDLVTTQRGMILLAYVDPVVMFTVTVWAIARGSDAISGEIDRGTMELLAAQPVSRLAILLPQIAATTAGSAAICLACWLGTSLGLWLMKLADVPSRDYLPAVLNLFAVTFFLAAFTTMVGSWQRSRWKTIGITGAFCLIQLILKVISRFSPDFYWLLYTTYLGAFEPGWFLDEFDGWTLAWQYSGLLFGLGILCYSIAAVIFSRRDLPAPL